MKKPILFFAILLSFGQMIAQKNSAWHSVDHEQISKLLKVRTDLNEEGEKYFSLDVTSFKQTLANAKDKFSKQPGVEAGFPNKNGEIEKFLVWENSNMEPNFQAKFPQVRAYVGKSISDGSVINFSVSPQGVQTTLFRVNGPTEFIEAYDKEATTYFVFDSSNRTKSTLNCTTTDAHLNIDLLDNNIGSNKSNNLKYKTMQLAMSCTAEYSNYFGAYSSADIALVIAAMNATMTRVNGIFEKDLAVHLNMIDNTSVIYYNSSTDPYDSSVTGAASPGATWNAQLMNNLHNTLGDSAFDIGHLFGGDGGGGNAGCIGCVCTNVLSTGGSANNSYKGSGFTSPSNGIPAGDSFDVDYVAHEMGHQMGGNHTFTHGYEGSIAQTEPGSGSTIMGYAGVTNYNVQAHSDPVFSYKSILQIQTNLNTKTCPISTTMTDNRPVVSAGLDYTIPVGTAFMLTGTATDADASDVLTYLWEQNDLGTNATTNANSEVIQTKTVGPNFRTFKPSTNIFRYFPQMGKILSGTIAITTATVTNWESVSSVARPLNFTFTARDNQAGAGQTNTDASIITVNATGGAFSVSSQSTTGLSYAGNSSQTVTWVPGSTALTPFNSPTVDILVSTNVSTALEGYVATTPSVPNTTTWTTIASGVPNNGSYIVTLPNVPATKTACRFMVKAVGNVFLAVNSKNFTITPSLANEEFGFTNFSIYPNPNKGNFNVKFDSSSSNDISIMVQDIRGRNIFDKQFSNTGMFSQNLQLENVESGVYLVTVKDGDKKIVKRIVIE